MNLTKQHEKEARKAHDLYWKSYLNGDVATLASLLDEDYNQIGSVENEVFFNKKDALGFIEATIGQVAGKVKMRNRKTKSELLDGFILIIERCDLYVMSDDNWVFYAKFRASSLLQQKPNGWKLVYQHSSVPDLKAQEGENIAIDKITKENLELKNAIKRRTIELENKNRELEIEATLEKVRSRTIAMHKSDELLEVIAIVDEQLKRLNFRFDNVSFAVKNQAHDYKFWLSAPGLPQPIHIHVPYINNPMFERVRNVPDDNLGIYSDILTTEESRQWHQHVFDNSVLQNLPEKTKKYILENGYARTIIMMPTIMLIIGNYVSKPYTEEENNVFKRFAGVFEQSYTRFLDLQKAEKQAREAQIEAALERVRSSAMSMQSSRDLNTLIGKVFAECTRLDIQLDRGIIMIYDQKTLDVKWWMANPEAPDNPRDFLLQYHKYVPYLAFLESWKNRIKKWTYVLEGKEKEEWDAFLFVETELALLPAEVKQIMMGFKKVYLNSSFNNFGCLTLATLEPMTDSNFDILLRFARVFDLTYTRFNDLKQAEAQAREATKQASLDRVRGEIASMRSAGDLKIITPLVWRELTTLGISFIRCGVFIMDQEEQQVEVYLSKPDGTSLAVMHLPFGASDLAIQTVDAWRKGNIFKQHWSKEEFLNWGQTMVKQEQIPDLDTYQGNEAPPESLFLHFIPFNQGMLYVGATQQLTNEEIDLAASLAEAFSIAYTRYEDFVKLEKAKAGIEEALAELKATQSQLVHQEKLASLGQLTAGIAHEIKNPLNFVKNFSEVSLELIEEARDEVKNNPPSPPGREAGGEGEQEEDPFIILEILDDIEANLQKIHEHGSRADTIVRSMLQHSRGGSGEMEPTHLNSLIKEYVNLAFHGMRAGKNPINVDINLQLEESVGEVPLKAEDFSRVILNLCNNAFDAMREKALSPSPSPPEIGVPEGRGEGDYNPKLTVSTKSDKGKILVEIEDNGPGIPDDIKNKILQPFFTTKKGTQGTGLGLSITNDIIKAHGGELSINSEEGTFTKFSIKLNG